MAMGRSKQKSRNLLEVTIMFEPTLLAADHLVEAYQQVVPPQGRKWKPSESTVDEFAPEIQTARGAKRWSS